MGVRSYQVLMIRRAGYGILRGLIKIKVAMMGNLLNLKSLNLKSLNIKLLFKLLKISLKNLYKPS